MMLVQTRALHMAVKYSTAQNILSSKVSFDGQNFKMVLKLFCVHDCVYD